MSTTAVPYVVDDFPGALSIKWMAAGWGIWETDSGYYRVDPTCYLVLNHGHVYSLSIDTKEPREAFCPFFATGFVENVRAALTAQARSLLDEPYGPARPEVTFWEHIRPIDDGVVDALRAMRAGVQSGAVSTEWLEDRFHRLAEILLLAQQSVRRQVAAIPAVRAGTREELYRRLCRGRDYLHAGFAERLTLAAIAREACLAPHHFHRLFRGAFGRTPHDYLIGLRIARARTLLAATETPITEICFAVGFESLGSFSALFRREVGASPTSFRHAARSSTN
jgi:AraC-like DNA-binding protein